MKNKTYKLEELHRGKWIPLKNDKDVQKIAKISERSAEILNMDSKATRLRYVLSADSGNEDSKSEVPTMENTKAEIVKYLNEKEIEVPSEAKNKEQLLELIK